jgi:hypothetical protein
MLFVTRGLVGLANGDPSLDAWGPGVPEIYPDAERVERFARAIDAGATGTKGPTTTACWSAHSIYIRGSLSSLEVSGTGGGLWPAAHSRVA